MVRCLLLLGLGLAGRVRRVRLTERVLAVLAGCPLCRFLLVLFLSSPSSIVRVEQARDERLSANAEGLCLLEGILETKGGVLGVSPIDLESRGLQSEVLHLHVSVLLGCSVAGGCGGGNGGSAQVLLHMAGELATISDRVPWPIEGLHSLVLLRQVSPSHGRARHFLVQCRLPRLDWVRTLVWPEALAGVSKPIEGPCHGLHVLGGESVKLGLNLPANGVEERLVVLVEARESQRQVHQSLGAEAGDLPPSLRSHLVQELVAGVVLKLRQSPNSVGQA